jgi:hypothetical protein
MSTTNTKPDPSPPLEALLELAVSKPAPDAALLDDLVLRHPEHAAGLTEAAVDLALDAARRGASGDDDAQAAAGDPASPAVAKAMARFRARAADLEARREAKAPAAVANPFASLDKASSRALAQRLHASTLFVMKLRDRHVRPETITAGFRRRVAEELSVPVEVLAAHFAAPSQVAQGAYFKSDERPVAGEKQTFEEAVKASGLTAEEQAYLLGL